MFLPFFEYRYTSVVELVYANAKCSVHKEMTQPDIPTLCLLWSMNTLSSTQYLLLHHISNTVSIVVNYIHRSRQAPG